MKRVELAVIGAGPGGLAAAAEAATRGVSVILFDDNLTPGGQYLRQISKNFKKVRSTEFDTENHASLLQVASHPRVQYMNNTIVWGLFDDKTIAYASGADSGYIHAENIIIASGAFDREVPFPGWTLPGVITAGAVLNLIKGQRIIPGPRVLIAGNGPLILLVACNLHWAGAEVIEVLEASRNGRNWMRSIGLLAVPSLIARGLRYYATLFRAGIPVKRGMTVLEAHGEDRVKEVVVAPIDLSGKVDRSKMRSVRVDSLVIGFGFNTSSEMTHLLGCEHVYSSLEGGWIPTRSSDFEMSIPGTFAIGDCAGIGGADLAVLEGRIAGLNVAIRLGHLANRDGTKISAPLKSKLARVNRFQRAIRRIFRPPENFRSLITDDTIICRCEDVTAGEVNELLRQGVSNMNSIKVLSRVGMGLCQGRNCLRTLAEIIVAKSGCSFSDLSLPRVRPPLKPVPIDAFLDKGLPSKNRGDSDRAG